MSMLITSLLLAVGPSLAQDASLTSQSFSGDLSVDGVPSTTQAPEYYVVQPGDTLWEISRKFLGRPDYWPRLWSINEHITNPHWIYPGNRIRFTMGTLLEPPRMTLDSGRPGGQYIIRHDRFTQVDVECGPDIRFTEALQADKYAAPGFLRFKEDVEIYGTVAKARPRTTILSDHDLIYLDVDDPDAHDCGEVLSIFRPTKKGVRHPENAKKRIGNVYRIVGQAVVVHRGEHYVAAEIRGSTDEILRGDLVGPLMPVSIEVEVDEPRGDLEGQIIARLGVEHFLATTGETLFLDIGRKDGVRVGTSLWVTEQRDEVLDTKKDDPDLPPSVIGRAVVVRVEDDQSTAVIVDAARNIEIGHKVTQHVN